jgi:hypothetical protein
MAILLKMFFPLDREHPVSRLPSQLKGVYPNCVQLEGLLDGCQALVNLWWYVRFTTNLLQNRYFRPAFTGFEPDLSARE